MKLLFGNTTDAGEFKGFKIRLLASWMQFNGFNRNILHRMIVFSSKEISVEFQDIKSDGKPLVPFSLGSWGFTNGLMIWHGI